MILWAIIALIALDFLYLVRGILLPFVLAIIITAVLDPAVRALVKRGMSKKASIWITLLVFFGTIITSLILLAPVIMDQVGGLKDKAELVVNSVAKPNPMDNFFVRGNPDNYLAAKNSKDPIDKFLNENAEILTRANLPTSKRAVIAQYIEPQREQIAKSAQTLVKSFIGIASGLASQAFMLLFVPLLVGMILPNTERFKLDIVRFVPPQLRRSTSDIAQDIGHVFSSYLRGVATAVFGYMVFMATLLTILGAPYGLLLGFLFGAIYMIPILSVLISSVTLFLVTMLSGKTDWLGIHFSSSLTYAVMVTLVYVVCHLIYDNIVYPRCVGNAVGLHPVVSMFVIFSGGALFGVSGMILAFPVAGCIKVILDRLLKVTNRIEQELILPEVPLRHRQV
jgi:predicted PurR-regulated permease PerM